jgi:hypothetical protein
MIDLRRVNGMRKCAKEEGADMKKMKIEARRAHRCHVFWAAATLTMAVLFCGCANIHYLFGNKLDLSALEERLIFGKSTSSDVIKEFGEPFGKGKEWAPMTVKQRTMWTYYYEAGRVAIPGKSDTCRLFLFVYLDGDLYDGYMWFSSLPP